MNRVSPVTGIEGTMASMVYRAIGKVESTIYTNGLNIDN